MFFYSFVVEIMYKFVIFFLMLRVYWDVYDYISYLCWGVGKFLLYMKEWGFSYLIRKVVELVLWKFGLFVRMGKSFFGKCGDYFKVNLDEN